MSSLKRSSVCKLLFGRDNVLAQFLFWLSVLLTFTRCAEVASPPGGEADKISPVLIGSIPENGAVNVGSGNTITLFFSERVVEPRSGNAVFLSPRPSKKLKLKWRSDRVEIVLPDSFHTDETYIVSLSANIADLRGNKLDSSAIIAFSSGPTIDSGLVAGHVYSNGRPIGGLMVVLYKASWFEDTTVIFDSLYPAYLTQSNRDGWFTFQYLPAQEYRLVAFEDKNHDERFNPERESFALPDRPVIVEGEMPLDNLQLSLTTQDTTTSEIISAHFTTDRLLKVRLSGEIPLGFLQQSPSNLMLRSQDDSGMVYGATSLLESEKQKTSVFQCYFDSLAEGLYDLELTYDVSKPTIHYSNIEVKYLEDKTPPTLVSFYPDRTPVFLDKAQIRAVFSEPLDTARITDGTFVLREHPDTKVPLSREWRDAFHLQLHPANLKEGASYTLSVTEFEIADLTGNILGDSLREFPFSILDSDSLGSVSGEVLIDIADRKTSPAILSFKKVGTDQMYNLPVSEKKFKIDVPAGKYLLSGFVDSDLNGQKDNGTIYPFRLAETFASYPDTIKVRARFETSGVHFEFR